MTGHDGAGAGPAFSFLCTAYRTEDYVGATIESVLAQTRPDWELIVVDNGRSDVLAGVVERYAATDPRIRLLRQENRGYVGGVHAAAAAARGPYLVLLNSDDQVAPDFCRRMGAVLDARPGIDALSCDAVLFTDDGTELRCGYAEYVGAAPPRLDRRYTTTAVLGGDQPYYGAVVRRSAWDALGGLVPDPPKVEDLTMWLRLTAGGFDVRAVPDRLARYRIRADSLSRDPGSVESFDDGVERALREAADASGRPEDRAAVDRRLRRARYFRALRRARWALLSDDVPTARREAALAFAQRRTVRSALVLAGVGLAPRLLRRAHPLKQRAAGALGSAAARWAPRPVRAPRAGRRRLGS